MRLYCVLAPLHLVRTTPVCRLATLVIDLMMKAQTLPNHSRGEILLVMSVGVMIVCFPASQAPPATFFQTMKRVLMLILSALHLLKTYFVRLYFAKMRFAKVCFAKVCFGAKYSASASPPEHLNPGGLDLKYFPESAMPSAKIVSKIAPSETA